MRVRYKPWAEDYLKEHPDLVDMDGSHAGKMSDWFDKKQPIYGAIYNYTCRATS